MNNNIFTVSNTNQEQSAPQSNANAKPPLPPIVPMQYSDKSTLKTAAKTAGWIIGISVVGFLVFVGIILAIIASYY